MPRVAGFGPSTAQSNRILPVISDAASNGIIGLFIKVRKFYAEAMDLNDPNGGSVIQHATLKHQDKVLSLLYTMTTKKPFAATNVDKEQNSILHVDKDQNSIMHVVAILAAYNQLDGISGAALQMQRGLQWYKEAWGIVRPKFKETECCRENTPCSVH